VYGIPYKAQLGVP